MANDGGPETPFPLREPGIPFPMKDMIEGIANGLFPGLLEPRIPPFPGIPQPTPGDGGARSAPPAGYTEALGLADYKAFRLGTLLVISATGTSSNSNQIADLRQKPWRIYPPQFEFIIYSPTFSLPTVRSFSFREQFGFPTNVETCVVHDAAGRHIVPIEDAVSDTSRSFFSATADGAGPHEATGYGDSLQAGFDNAVHLIPPPGGVADGINHYRMLESGLISGGIAGLHQYFCRVALDSDPFDGPRPEE